MSKISKLRPDKNLGAFGLCETWDRRIIEKRMSISETVTHMQTQTKISGDTGDKQLYHLPALCYKFYLSYTNIQVTRIHICDAIIRSLQNSPCI